MKEINKLVGLVTTKLECTYDVLDLSGQISNPGKEQQLYNGVLRGKYPDDISAATGMYNADIYDQRFRMLKSRLRYKLYNLLYHLDFEDANYSETSRIKLECTEYLHKADVLVNLEEFGMVEKQINKALTLADSFQLTAVTMRALEIMRMVHSTLCQPTDFELTQEQLKEIRKIYALEEQANDIFFEINMLLTKSIHSRHMSVEKVKSAADQLFDLWKEAKSYNIYEQYYKLSVWHALLEGDFESVLKIIEKADQDVSKMKIDDNRIDTGYNNYMAAKAFLNLGDFKRGFESVQSSLKALDKSSNLWFDLSELYFLMAMHAHDFALADKVLASVLKTPSFKRISVEQADRWKLFRLYLNFADLDADRMQRVRFRDAYQAADHYFKELKGYYISLPVLEFLHLLRKGKTDLALAKLNDVDNYFYKHLNDPGKNQREKQFFKLISLLKSNDFDVVKTKETGAKYFDKMKERKMNAAFSDYEIIPYEDLWEIILRVVGNKKIQKAIA